MSAPRRYRHLLLPADRNEITLPQAVLTARAVLVRVDAALSTLTAPPAPQDVFDTTVAAALSTDQPDTLDVSAILDHTRQQGEHEARLAVLRTAHDRADTTFRSTIDGAAETIVVDHIRPAGTELWGRITASVKALGNVEITSADAMLRASDRARKAYLTLSELAASYGRLRAALAELLRDDPPEHDTLGDHAEFHAGLCTVVGRGWRTTPSSPAPQMPWPADDRGRLVWIARHHHTPWWPTPTERDGAWMELHREAHDHQKQRNTAHRQIHGWGGVAA